MIEIEIKEDEISAALARVQAGLSDLTPLMQELGEYFVESTKARFRAGKAPDGSVWAAKSPVTLARYPGSTAPLIGESKSLSTTISAQPFPDRLEWGSPMVYAAMQQFGGTRGRFPHLWGDIPARPFLGLSDEDRVAVIGIVEEYLGQLAGTAV